MNESIFKDTMVDMTWKQIKEKGKKGVPVLLPLGVIEEHGPHLPLGTDIYMSYVVCSKIRNEAIQAGKDCIIAPPYYWGINKCTGAFPGCFSTRPETMKMMLHDIFANLQQFGFHKIICINQHGDPLHTQTILEAIKEATEHLKMQIQYLIEPYDLGTYGLTGQEEFCLVDRAQYPEDIIWDNSGKLDIHAGAYETAAMSIYYPKLLDKQMRK
ncbi:MAG: creatininase family protein [Clostridiales bacterium]|nr:creatininase family protein [Clostridiales bacterium]